MSTFRTPWRAVAAMFVLHGGLFGIWASRIPAVAAKHGLEPGALGLVLLVLAAGGILSSPVAGRAADRLGAYRMTRILALFYVCALGLLALAPTVATLALALLFFGVGFGAMDVTMNAWAGEVELQAGRPIMSVVSRVWSVGAGDLAQARGYAGGELRRRPSAPLHRGQRGSGALPALSVARGAWVSKTRVRQRCAGLRLSQGCASGGRLAVALAAASARAAWPTGGRSS